MIWDLVFYEDTIPPLPIFSIGSPIKGYQTPSFSLAQIESAKKSLEWAFGPFFVSRGFVPDAASEITPASRSMSIVKSSVALVTELIDTTIQALGLELWGVELLQQGRFSLLRIYIEREEGVTIEDCEKVSRQVSALLDVEDPIAGEYTLEVSSPGVDRPLFSIEQYEQYVGSEVNLKLRRPLDGRRKFKGQIIKVSEGVVSLLVEGTEYDLEYSEIESASIVF